MTKRSAKNTADILQNRSKEYESEKGKNLATKEDIEEITKKVEEVKVEVSLSKQKKYEQLVEQERILLDILKEATNISQAQNKLILYLYDTSSRKRYDELVESVNDTLSHLYHLSNLAIVSISIDGLDCVIDELSTAATLLGSQVNVIATNAANLVEQYNNHFNYAMNNAAAEKDKTFWLTSSLESKQQIESLRKEPILGKEDLNTAIESYCLWLKKLYGKDFFTFAS